MAILIFLDVVKSMAKVRRFNEIENASGIRNLSCRKFIWDNFATDSRNGIDIIAVSLATHADWMRKIDSCVIGLLRNRKCAFIDYMNEQSV